MALLLKMLVNQPTITNIKRDSIRIDDDIFILKLEDKYHILYIYIYIYIYMLLKLKK